MADAGTGLGAGYEVTLVRVFDAPAGIAVRLFSQTRSAWRNGGAPSAARTPCIRWMSVPAERSRSPWPVQASRITSWAANSSKSARPRRLVFLSKAFEAPDGGWGIVNSPTP